LLHCRAGSFDWPEDHGVYLDCAADMVRMLRPHPSLLFWNGGNELYPVEQQPPGTNPDPGSPAVQAALLEQLEAVVRAEDPGRFWITSSMSNFTDFDPAYALAPKVTAGGGATTCAPPSDRAQRYVRP
jgi:hypothetical protein